MRAQYSSVMDNSLQQALKGKTPTVKQQQAIVNMKNRMVAFMQGELAWEKLEPLYLRLYKESFTEQEVTGMLSFYKTPAGQAVINKMPLLMQRTMVEVQKMLSGAAPQMQKIQDDFIAELKDAGNEAQPQQPRKEVGASAAACGGLQFVQNDHVVPSDGNSVSLIRSPFLIYFVGSGTNPMFHASPQPSLALTLKKMGQAEIWNMGGNGMASDDDELVTKRSFALLGDEKSRTEYVSHLGANYPEILRRAIASRPQVTVLGEIPQNPFRYLDNASQRPLAKVGKIDGQKVEDTTIQNIYLVTFSVQEKVTPLLYRTSWNACELRFTTEHVLANHPSVSDEKNALAALN